MAPTTKSSKANQEGKATNERLQALRENAYDDADESDVTEVPPERFGDIDSDVPYVGPLGEKEYDPGEEQVKPAGAAARKKYKARLRNTKEHQEKGDPKLVEEEEL